MTLLPSSTAAEPTPGTSREDARVQLANRFRQAGLDQSDLDARLLVCAACGIDHLTLVRDPGLPLGKASGTLAAYAARRLAREPVARILGRREFWGLPFMISPDVLDPRPDTEGLVGAVLDALGGRRDAALRLLDLGTGSGAILAALLHELPGATGIGVDRSPEACRVAAANLRALGLDARAGVVCGSWTKSLAGTFDAIVSNPPYIPSREIAGLDAEVLDHDPRDALDGGADGLDAYRAILRGLRACLAPGGVGAVECGWDQGDAVAALFREAGLAGVMVYRDLAGHQRVVLGTIQSPIAG